MSNLEKTTENDFDQMLLKVIQQGASDLHLTVNLPPTIRVTGILQPLIGYDKLTAETIGNLIYPVLKDEQKKLLTEVKELDFSYMLKEKGRFRINVFFEKGNLASSIRLIPLYVPSLEELHLPSILYEFCKLPQGLVLITGATGTGKSTTLASMIDWINTNRNSHVITIEDPIEFVFESNKALIQQREIHVDTKSWKNALRAVLREDPNIILIGEMRDYETIASALTIAETGHLVFGTLHTNSAAQTVDRMVDVFPDSQQAQIKAQFASVIEGVITQTLVRGIDTSIRYPALEILIANSAVRNTIREGKAYSINNIINTSFDLGMTSIERSLANLVNEGKVELEEAQSKTTKPEEILRLIKKTR